MPYSLTQPIRREGLPTTKAYGGISLVTTAPAPIMAYSPDRMAANDRCVRTDRSTFADIRFQILVFTGNGTAGIDHICKNAAGPKKTSSPQVTPV